MKVSLDKFIFYILILIVVTLPLQVTESLFPVHILGSKFPVLEVSRILTALGLLALTVKFLFVRKVSLPKDKISVLLYIFVALNGLSLAVFPSKSGLLEILRYTFYLGFYLLIINAIQDTKDLEKTVKALMIGGLGISLFSIFQYFSGFYLWSSGLSGAFTRVNATFLDPNVLATFLGILIIFSTVFYSCTRDKRFRVFSSLLAGTSLAALFLTFSRAGLIATGVSFLFLVFFLPKTFRMLVFYLFLVLVGGIVYFSFEEVRGRTANIYDIGVQAVSGTLTSLGGEEFAELPADGGQEKDEGRRFNEVPVLLDRFLSLLPFNYDRRAAVKAGVLMFLNNPVFGVGLGNFQEIFTEVYAYLIKFEHRGVLQGSPITLSHTSFVTIISELGLAGVVWFLAFLYTLVVAFLHTLKKYPKVKNSALAAFASLLLMLIHTQFRGGLFSDPYFWLLSGFIVVSKKVVSGKPK